MRPVGYGIARHDAKFPKLPFRKKKKNRTYSNHGLSISAPYLRLGYQQPPLRVYI